MFSFPLFQCRTCCTSTTRPSPPAAPSSSPGTGSRTACGISSWADAAVCRSTPSSDTSSANFVGQLSLVVKRVFRTRFRTGRLRWSWIPDSWDRSMLILKVVTWKDEHWGQPVIFTKSWAVRWKTKWWVLPYCMQSTYEFKVCLWPLCDGGPFAQLYPQF